MLQRHILCWQPSECIDIIETDVLYGRDLDNHDVDIWRIPSLLRGSVGFCATSEVILIVILLYCFVPPTRDHTDVIIHVNPWKNQCKPWGILELK